MVKEAEQTLEFRDSDILHQHYYPTMHEAIADATLEKCAEEVIKVCCEQIRKQLI